MSVNKEAFDEIMQSFNTDGQGLAAIFESGELMNILDDFIDYELFLKNRNKNINAKKLVKRISKGTNVIYGDTNNSDLRKVFYYSHLAVCCELFYGWKLSLNEVNREAMDALIMQSLSSLKDATSDKLKEIQDRVQRADAVRTIQILRMMGLLSSNSDNQKQFSFASGNAQRELDGLHVVPHFKMQKNILDNNKEIIVFDKTVKKPEHAILIDNDPAFKDLYASLNENYQGRMLAFNEDADSAILKVMELIETKSIKPCNLVAGIRIDHEIIPDVSSFFNQLLPVLDTVSDFIISVGAGHTVKEFEGRINLISTLFKYLKKYGLDPVRIVLHGSGSFEDQRNTPLFGCGPTTTYEILYCKIIKKKLLK